VADPASDAGGHWFEALADHLGPAYLRYSFTKGTEQEVAFLVDALDLGPGDRVLDVGCGPGRHALLLAKRGIAVHGVDISQRFVDLADAAGVEGATFERLDARQLPFEAEFDAVISLCQGAFGLAGHGDPVGGPNGGPDGGPVGGPVEVLDPDGAILDGMARALRPGGRLAVSAFSAYFQTRWLDEEHMTFDAGRGVNHERTSIKDVDGRDAEVDLWTSCFTPRELRLLAERSGLRPRGIWSVSPGAYGRHEPTVESHEFLLVAERPAGPST
jgi:SAM-dependent methyltransferase